ncbi:MULTISPECIES: hypothetical protein [Streptomyces]|uniref:Uncharacterized protein n=1 Tax=Streptomyces sp. NBC_00093 TaxID=2975649 RepID=A0AAU2A7M8_9ACTN
MSETDPHIHVEQKVGQSGADVRNAIVATFGRVPDGPTVVTTGCGLQVPYAMTSPRPESVTCLTCREHAHREHLGIADQVERLGWTPGMNITSDQLAKVVDWHRDRAKRFSG